MLPDFCLGCLSDCCSVPCFGHDHLRAPNRCLDHGIVDRGTCYERANVGQALLEYQVLNRLKPSESHAANSRLQLSTRRGVPTRDRQPFCILLFPLDCCIRVCDYYFAFASGRGRLLVSVH